MRRLGATVPLNKQLYNTPNGGQDNGLRWLIADENGSIRRVLSKTGATTIEYDAFGKRRGNVPDTDASLPRLQFGGMSTTRGRVDR